MLVETHGETEIGPIMSEFESLQSIHLEVHLAIEVLLVEGLHGNLALAMVGGTVMLAVEVQIVLDGTATVLGLLSLAGRDRRSHGPEGHENGDGCEESEENGGVETASDLTSQVPGDHDHQEDHQSIGEAVTTRGVRRNRSILDSR